MPLEMEMYQDDQDDWPESDDYSGAYRILADPFPMCVYTLCDAGKEVPAVCAECGGGPCRVRAGTGVKGGETARVKTEPHFLADSGMKGGES